MRCAALRRDAQRWSSTVGSDNGSLACKAASTDGRQILCSLTKAGVEARRQRQAARLAWLTAAIDRFDADERRTLVAAIALIKRLGEG